MILTGTLVGLSVILSVITVFCMVKKRRNGYESMPETRPTDANSRIYRMRYMNNRRVELMDEDV